MAKKVKKTKEQEYDGSTPLKSVMQEAVTDSIMAGMFQVDAYMEQYPTCKSRDAGKAGSSRLLANVNFQSRLAYKRGLLAKKLDITLERQCKEFEINKDLARGLKQVGAANQAISEQGRLCGLYEADNKQKQGKTVVEILALVANARRLEASGVKQIESTVIEAD